MRSPAPGSGRSNSAVERAIQHQTTQVNSSSLAPQPLHLALRDRHRIAAVASHQEQRRFPDLALVRHHHDLINPDGAVQFHDSDRQG